MTKLREFYRCETCGNIVEVVHEGAPSLACCGKPMIKLEAKTVDQGHEKHVPIIEEAKNGSIVKVGSIEHPMESEHYIEFIEVLLKDRVLRKELKPGQAPEAKFCESKTDIIEIRENCSVHGLWKNK